MLHLGFERAQGFAGDYSEAFTIESGLEIPDRLVAEQQVVIAELGELLDGAESPLERERLGYLWGQIRFLDPYAQAWRKGVLLHKLIMAQQERRSQGDAAGAAAKIRQEGVPLWVSAIFFDSASWTMRFSSASICPPRL